MRAADGDALRFQLQQAVQQKDRATSELVQERQHAEQLASSVRILCWRSYTCSVFLFC